jgi:hypothetical protein
MAWKAMAKVAENRRALSLAQERQMHMNAPNTVKYQLEPSNPPPVTTEQTQRLAAIAARHDAAIDYSEISVLRIS